MKRQIITALSTTLLISSPITLNAGRNNKKKNQKTTASSASSSANDLTSLAIVAAATLNVSPAATAAQPATASDELSDKTPIITMSSKTLPLNATAPVDEFDPADTKAQRAALFLAIAALAQKENQGLKHIATMHEEERKKVLKDLYQSEDTHEIIKKSATSSLTADQQPLDLFPQPRHEEEFDKASVSSSNGSGLEMPEDQSTQTNNNNNNAPSTITTSSATQTPSTTTPASQTSIWWRMLGYK